MPFTGCCYLCKIAEKLREDSRSWARRRSVSRGVKFASCVGDERIFTWARVSEKEPLFGDVFFSEVLTSLRYSRAAVR